MITVNRKRIGDIAIFEISGRLDSINIPVMRNPIMQTLSFGTFSHIVLDMADVDYLSAAGLRVLREIEVKSGDVHIAAPSDRALEVLNITGLDAKYKLYNSLTDALFALNPITNGLTYLDQGWLTDYAPSVSGIDALQWQKDVIDKYLIDIDETEDQLALTALASGVRRLVATGTTTVLDISRDGRSIELLANTDLRGVVYIALQGTQSDAVERYFNTLRMNIEQYRPKETKHLKLGIAIPALPFIHPDLLKKAIAYARIENLPLMIGVGRTEAIHNFMNKGEGALVTDYYSDSVPAIESPNMSEIAYLEKMGALELKPMLLHCVHVSADDMAKMQETGCTVVHTPMSDMRLNAGRMALETFLEKDIPVYLGTDSLAITSTLNVFDDAMVAQALHYGKVSIEKIMGLVHQALPV